MGAQDFPFIKILFNGSIGAAFNTVADGPFGAGVILRLHTAHPAYQRCRLREAGMKELLLMQPLLCDLLTVHISKLPVACDNRMSVGKARSKLFSAVITVYVANTYIKAAGNFLWLYRFIGWQMHEGSGSSL